MTSRPIARGRPAREFGRALVALRGLATACLATTTLGGCSHSTPAGEPVPPATAAVVPTPRSPQDARYVSVDGNDRGPGTLSLPWRTLAKSLPKLYAGQVLYVHEGLYREVLTKLNLHDGREGRPIAVTNVPGEVPVLMGAVSLHRPDHWAINGLNVTWDPAIANPPRFMVKIIGGVGWGWSNSEIWGSRGAANMFVAGFGTSEPSGWSLKGDCFHGLRAAPAADPATNVMLGVMVRPGRGTITRNVIYNRAGQDNLVIGSARGSPRNVNIRYNTIYGGRLAVTLRGGSQHVRISRNVLGAASSDVLVRFDLKASPGTVLRQNYGIISPTGEQGAGRLMRPVAEAKIGGPGNVVSDQDPHFPDPGSCIGFDTPVSTLSPYGRYGR